MDENVLILHTGSVRIMLMDTAIVRRIAKEAALSEGVVAATIELLEKGATPPFIARYRKDATSGLREHQVQAIQGKLIFYRELENRRASLLKLLKDRGKLTDELRRKVETSYDMFELDGIFHLFKARRKTRASEAIKKGLEPLAEYIWNRDPDAWSLEEHADVFIDPDKHVNSREEALQGAADIIAEWVAENWKYRETLREMLWKEGYVVSTVVPAKMDRKTKYNMYYDHREPVATIPSHRVLAIRRGSKEGILTSSIQGDNSKALEFLLTSVFRDGGDTFSEVIEAATRDGYSRIMRPMIETEVRAQLKARADSEAISVFRDNLKNLLLSPPAGPIVVIGLDPSKGDERKLAVVNKNGEYLESATIRFKPAKEEKDQQPTRDVQKDKIEQDKSTEQTEAAQQDAPASESPKEDEAPSSPTSPLDSNFQSEPAEVEVGVLESSPENPGIVSEDSGDKAAALLPAPHPVPSDEAEAESAVAETMDPSNGQSVPQPEETANVGTDATTPTEPLQEQPPSELIPPDPAVDEQPASLVAPESEPEPDSAPSQSATKEDPVVKTTSQQELDEGKDTLLDKGESASLQKSSATINTGSAEESSFIQPAELPGETEVVAGAVGTDPRVPQTEDISSSPPEPLVSPELQAEGVDGIRHLLRDLIVKHEAQAIAVGSGTGSRALEVLIRQMLAEDGIENVLVASVNDAGVAIYSSSRVAREEFPDLPPSTRAAVSIARRLQDPLSELVKVDPKLIGVGQYQHDVDQKELHRQLIQTVQSCVNNVGVDLNKAGFSSLRYVSGISDRLARRIVNHRDQKGPFATREDLREIPGMTDVVYEQAAGFLRINNGTNQLDGTAIHPESYPLVEKMAASCGTAIADLMGNKEKISSLEIKDFFTDTVGRKTLSDIQDELLRPGRDPRRAYKAPNFRPDVKNITDLQEGMALDGTVTNVTNFGAFVDIGIQQDGLVHLSQISNRFIRDPREAVKVGDVVRVKVISLDVETKRIGLSIKALLPSLPRKRKRQRRRGEQTDSSPPSTSPGSSNKDSNKRQKSKNGSANRESRRRPRTRRRNNPKTEKPETSVPESAEPVQPEASLQEKIAILQSKFKGIS